MRRTGLHGIVGLTVLALAVACGGADTAAPREIELAEMESYGCGHGFWLGTSEQDLAVHLVVADQEAAARGDVPEQATLPDDAWDATVLVGRDLFSNWCDDVLGPGEPEPDVRERWPITSGTITLQEAAPRSGCPGELTATLEDLQATRPDGTRVELGSREVTNDTWGCFAG